MRIARQTPQELVVVDSSRSVSAVCLAAALVMLYLVIIHHKPQGYVLVAVLVFFGVIMDLRKTVTFDAVRRVVRWNGRKIFKAESGEIPFDEITDIGTERQRVAQRDVLLYRLTIVTPRGIFPIAYNFRSQPDQYSALRSQILEFIRPASSGQVQR